jgi:hypothetical protein
MKRLALALLAVLVAQTPAAAEATVLRGDAFITAMNGNTLAGKNVNGIPFKLYFVPGGQATIQEGSAEPQFGSWSIDKSGDVCLKWAAGVTAQAGCFTVRASGSDITWSNKDGSSKGGLLGVVAPLTMKQGQ